MITPMDTMGRATLDDFAEAAVYTGTILDPEAAPDIPVAQATPPQPRSL